MAHPHVWISGYEQIQFNAQGAITAVTHSWIFDQMYSAFATTGLGKNGVESRAEFSYLVDVNTL